MASGPTTPDDPVSTTTATGGCPCCGSGSGGGIELCDCPTDCTTAIRYLTITGTDDCDGTYELTCELIDYGGGLGTHPAWLYEGTFGFDDFGTPCNEGAVDSAIWRLKCGPTTGIYTLEFEPPGEGVATYTAVEQQCDPFYARFEFTGIIGLVPCCDYTGTPIGVVTD